jgi:hypothetical protein
MRREVCIQRDYCPLCYRGGACTTDRVPADSARINEEQRECSKAFGGLPLLDLAQPGEICQAACRLICLVCGTPMAYPCEPEFESVQELTERYGEEAQEIREEMLGEGMHGLMAGLGERMLVDLERRFIGKLRRAGMAWHPRWEKLVHSRCLTQASSCGCLVPRGLSICPQHKKSVVERASAATARRPPPPPRESETTVKKAPSPPKLLVIVPATTASTAAMPVTMIKATWLRPATTTTVHPPPAPPPHPRAARVLLPKPPPPKPNPRLEAAAKGSGKLDAWSGKASDENNGSGNSARKDKKRSFNMATHERDFDMFQHGYLRKNGVDMYRFPDGTEVQVFSNVNEMTPEGLLKCQNEAEEQEEATAPAAPQTHAKKKPVPAKKANSKLESAAKGSGKLDVLFSAGAKDDNNKKR